MKTVQLDTVDKKLLTIVQEELPLVSRPWDALAERLGVTYEELMKRVKKLHEDGVIRRFGPVLETDRVGLSARTLVLMKIPHDRVEEVGVIVSGFDTVTHNYLREHEYNMWFTLITSSEDQLRSSLQEILEAAQIPESDILDLPVTRKHRIKVSYKFR
ncbi:MAG: AsnC family transcriptional regulator [Candidatus Bathyarchaeota archaeon]|nr:AsnC family transcriptional regulator [Candidatus Bathyarchaeota archaeon]